MNNKVKGVVALIAIVALVSNMFTVLLFIKKSKWLKKAHGFLIFELSIQDILTAICLLSLPSFILDHDAYPLSSSSKARDSFCSLVWSRYFPFSLGVTTVYTCLMLRIERWFAVVKPLYYGRYEHSTAVVGSSMGCRILLRNKHSTECQTNWTERDIHIWLGKGWKFDYWKDTCCCIIRHFLVCSLFLPR